jgi:hypothetical protein
MHWYRDTSPIVSQTWVNTSQVDHLSPRKLLSTIPFITQIEEVNCTFLVLKQYLHPTYSYILPLLPLACTKLDNTVGSAHQIRAIDRASFSKTRTASTPEEEALKEPAETAALDAQLVQTALVVSPLVLESPRNWLGARGKIQFGVPCAK